MTFPFQQPPQPPPNFSPNHVSMFPESFNRELWSQGDGSGNKMLPSREVPGVHKSNRLQKVLDKFFPSGSTQQAATLPVQTESGVKTAGGLNNTLDNVQQVLKIIQQTAPIVQEYGPMVKNIPTMLRMLKMFNDLDDDESETKTEKKQVEQSDQYSIKTSQVNKKDVTHEPETVQQPFVETEKSSSIQNGESKPLLFI